MEDYSRARKRRILVVSDNVVMALDLVEILKGQGHAHIDVLNTMNVDLDGGYEIAFFALPVSHVIADWHVRALARGGTRIVILNGETVDANDHGLAFHTLAKPFRSEDVEQLLERVRAPSRLN